MDGLSPMSLPATPPPLEVYLLGLVDFEEVQQLQRRLVYELGEGPSVGAALVLCEHPPTISVGRSGSRLHIAADDDELRALGVAVHWVNRGGGCVLHLPGQLAASLVMPLDPAALDLKRYLDGLHEAIIGVLGGVRPDRDLPAGRFRGLSGQCPGGERRRGGQPLDRLPRPDPERRPVPGRRSGLIDEPGPGAGFRSRSGRRRWRPAGSGPPPWPGCARP